MKEKFPVKIISEKRDFRQEKAYLRRDRSGKRVSARSVGSWREQARSCGRMRVYGKTRREERDFQRDSARSEGSRGEQARYGGRTRGPVRSREREREREFTAKPGEKRESSGEIRGFPERESEIRRKNVRFVENEEIPARRRERGGGRALNFVFYFWSVLL
jgi:hypothetical protein